MDGGGGAGVSHALHVLRCGALISVHAEQAHDSVCLGGGLGAGLVGLAGGCGVGLAAGAFSVVAPSCSMTKGVIPNKFPMLSRAESMKSDIGLSSLRRSLSEQISSAPELHHVHAPRRIVRRHMGETLLSVALIHVHTAADGEARPL